MASSGGIRQREPQRPTVFLDYDGVLHPDAVYREGERIVLRTDGFRLFEWTDVLEDLLTPYPALQIVLSTSWARVLGFDTVRSHLPESLRRRVVGATVVRNGSAAMGQPDPLRTNSTRRPATSPYPLARCR
ncbi:HAD domain-containing protein [Aromatoleum evansii]|uniref:HAD domain-containing protein n=1 Tax=Aromatoleum evansii TaxID=59406 RepID=A0ABZ1AGE5_AROEV|nr:HAD domain-containing protein [Aromatoleum evansii]